MPMGEEVGPEEEGLDDDPTNGLFCFIDQSRPCGPDCMSFITHPRTPNKELSQQQQNCVLLSSIERGSRHLTIIAATMDGVRKAKRTVAADQQRADTSTTPTEGGPFAQNPFPAPKDPPA